MTLHRHLEVLGACSLRVDACNVDFDSCADRVGDCGPQEVEDDLAEHQMTGPDLRRG